MGSVKKEQRKINKRLSEMIPKLDSGDSVGLVTAFKLSASDSGSEGSEPALINEAYSVNIYEPEYYTIREHEGMVGIFDDDEELVKKINTAVSSLSASDRQSLLLGIKAQTYGEIEKIIKSLS
jgi:hypothetical protein